MNKPFQIHEGHTNRWQRLKRLLAHDLGFRLIIMQYNDSSYRDALTWQINQEQRQKTDQTPIINLQQYENYNAFENHLFQIPYPKQTHWINLDQLDITRRDNFFKGFNYHRENIAQHCQGFILLWLHDPVITQLAQQAADFWAWREAVFDFDLPVGLPYSAATYC